PEQVENLSIHYVKTIEEALRVSLPVVAEALAAKVFLESEGNDSQRGSKTAKPVQSPVVTHDKVVTWQS
ncbi:MAG: hypothetical protein WBQ87_01005, partial [Candidatus Sulfotelmatobacter sp.]